jgi:hypothetical protein
MTQTETVGGSIHLRLAWRLCAGCWRGLGMVETLGWCLGRAVLFVFVDAVLIYRDVSLRARYIHPTHRVQRQRGTTCSALSAYSLSFLIYFYLPIPQGSLSVSYRGCLLRKHDLSNCNG